jgi:DNA-binding transcriptional ArsR family regulator
MSQVSPPAEDVVSLVAHPLRRHVLAALVDESVPLSLDALAAATARRTDEFDGDAERMRLVLHHQHLPKLAESGVVEYDPERTVVTATNLDGATVDRVLDAATRIAATLE